MGRGMPTAFASHDELDPDALSGAPVRWPRPSRLEEGLRWKPRPAAEAAAALELHTVGDLLEHLPRDSGEARTIAELAPDEVATVIVEVRSITARPVRRRGMKPLVEVVVSDGTGVMKATFFNQPWLKDQYKPGTRLMLAGKYQGRNRFRVNTHARTDAVAAVGEAASQYPATKGITSTQILAAVREHRDAVRDVVEPLPAALRVAERMPDRPAAFAAAHFGDREGGRARLAFDELLVDQIVQLRLRAERRATQAAAPLRDEPSLSRVWRDTLLPFALTGDQAAAMDEIYADLASDKPMQRLLMGEVGSGKTVVALHAMLRAVEHGWQAAMMAPTETLAEQHFATLQALMPGELVPAALLTGATPAARRREALGRLASGELAMVVGTHALIEPDVEFGRLAVCVVDEQHRFGVRQRAALDAKGPDGAAPHALHMTATPIPRTLSLTAYGDLDATVLRELPAGRQPADTWVVGEEKRAGAYAFIRDRLREGRQAYVVCPLVEGSETLEAKAATEEAERLRATEFADFEVGLLHGQMPPREKQAAMGRFAAGESDVLVATSVIEVGIDVPNATVMVVEGAERYGLSQLHQLRGRVGRGRHASHCILFADPASELARRRLEAIASERDGFKLAEVDLALRGEGEILGTRQHGLPRFRVAQLPEDVALLMEARRELLELLDRHGSLDAPELGPLLDVAGQR